MNQKPTGTYSLTKHTLESENAWNNANLNAPQPRNSNPQNSVGEQQGPPPVGGLLPDSCDQQHQQQQQHSFENLSSNVHSWEGTGQCHHQQPPTRQERVGGDELAGHDITQPTYALVQRMQRELSNNVAQKTRMKVMKCSRVRPEGMLIALGKFAQFSQSPQMRAEVERVIDRIRQRLSAKEPLSEVITCAEEPQYNNSIGDFEFCCLAVKVYDLDGEQACDYALSTYSEKETPMAESRGGLIGTLWKNLFGYGGKSSRHHQLSNQTTAGGSHQQSVKQLIEARFLLELLDGGFGNFDDSGRFSISPK